MIWALKMMSQSIVWLTGEDTLFPLLCCLVLRCLINSRMLAIQINGIKWYALLKSATMSVCVFFPLWALASMVFDQ